MTEHEFEMGEGALCWFKDATIRYRCGRIADDPIHHTAAAPTEQATQPGFWEEQQDYADERDSTEQATADRGYHSQRGILAKHREASAGDAATDADSTAEVCGCVSNSHCEIHTENDYCPSPEPWTEDQIRATFERLGGETNQDDFMRNIRYDGPDWSKPPWAGTSKVCKMWHDLYGACELPFRHSGPHSRVPGGATEANTWTEVSAGSPVTAGVPDTASYRATFGLAARSNPGSSSWHIVKLCDALDAARGELVTARGENETLLAELADRNDAALEEGRSTFWRRRAEAAEAERDELQALVHQMETDLHEACQDARRDNLAAHANMIRAEGAEAERDEAMRLQNVEKSAADSMARKVNELRDELAAANARIAAALAVISGYDDIRDTCTSKADRRQCLLCDLRDALGVPAAGEQQ